MKISEKLFNYINNIIILFKIKDFFEKSYGKDNVVLYTGKTQNIDCEPNEIIDLGQITFD